MRLLDYPGILTIATEANPTPPIALPIYSIVSDLAKYMMIHGMKSRTEASIKQPFLPILSIIHAFTKEPGREASSNKDTTQDACS